LSEISRSREIKISKLKERRRAPIMLNQTSVVCDPCDYNLSLDYSLSVCGPGGGGCVPATLFSPLETEQRAFHPSDLRQATIAINAILDLLRNNAPEGQELSFLRVPGGGAILAWVNHGIDIPDNPITPDSPANLIKQAFGLVSSEAAYQSQAEE
jgi:hypothetical protein